LCLMSGKILMKEILINLKGNNNGKR
jgi:hypothetical protein